jgi:ABC-type multidrug transport system fused ATPase/permease subunit
MAVDVGLQTPVGVGGSRLTPVMRQRVAIARALLKGPPLLVLDDPAALLDQAAQTQLIDAVLAEPGWGIVWVLQRPALAKAFERVLVLDQGRIVADGPFASVVQNGDILARPETIDEKPQEPG